MKEEEEARLMDAEWHWKAKGGETMVVTGSRGARYGL